MPHVDGVNDGVGYGVLGKGNIGDGVHGTSENAYGVLGESNIGYGVGGFSSRGYGVYGFSSSISLDYAGVAGSSRDGFGVVGYTSSGTGVYGQSTSGYGVSGYSPTGFGVFGSSYSGFGVYGYTSNGYGLYCWSGPTGYAAYLEGRVFIRGPLEKPGGQFKIDHPLDPANKYLSHSFVESPDMKNVYDGVVALDNKGEAEIELPDWFGALNKDFRYQLTALGAPGPNLYIAEEISDSVTNDSNKNNRFKIAGGNPRMKVSWQVTGIRKDPWANAHRIEVEEEKRDKERGYYLYPELYGKAAEKGISRLLFPTEEEKEKKEQLLINE